MTEKIANTELGHIVWGLIYGEEPPKTRDPNKPENLPIIKKEEEGVRERFAQYARGNGKPFFDHVKTKLRADIFDLVTLLDNDCACITCQRVRQLRSAIELVAMSGMATKKE
jgi:hypothetical protein